MKKRASPSRREDESEGMDDGITPLQLLRIMCVFMEYDTVMADMACTKSKLPEYTCKEHLDEALAEMEHEEHVNHTRAIPVRLWQSLLCRPRAEPQSCHQKRRKVDDKHADAGRNRKPGPAVELSVRRRSGVQPGKEEAHLESGVRELKGAARQRRRQPQQHVGPVRRGGGGEGGGRTVFGMSLL